VADKHQDGTLVYYVGGYYEYSVNGSETHTTKYYGGEAMRVDNDLCYILSDHLGSTSVVTDGRGTTWRSSATTDGVSKNLGALAPMVSWRANSIK
jgi:hypothetical protein